MRFFRRRIIDNSVPIDMTPMIDCVFLLLIFFILTSNFRPDEKQIASLLPTNEGQPTHLSPPPVISERIRIAIIPAGAPANASEAELNAWVKSTRGRHTTVDLRIGGRDCLRIERKNLEAQLDQVHRYIADNLAILDQHAASPKDAPTVEIHCFSDLPWSMALLVYDAVRAYESAQHGQHHSLADARTVNFAPPRIRNFSPLEDGKELAELQRLR
jgi:biopolymer transport protein ExbD